MTTRATQNATVLRLLRRDGIVSARSLVYFDGISRAAARIYDLRQAGHDIRTIRGERLPDGTQEMASYELVEKPVREEMGL